MQGKPRPEPGRLFLVGGAARLALLRFVRLAGGKRAHIVVMPHASARPAEVSRELQDELAACGAGKVSILTPGSATGIPAGATAVYLAGGDQSRLVRRLAGAQRSHLSNFLMTGGLVGGSSAGAAAMPLTMIAGGMSDGVLRNGALRLKPGLGLLPAAVVDTHFSERQRFNRLMAAVTLLPGTLGIGLDEDTAIEVAACGTASVHGKGHAWFFVPGQRHASSLGRSSGRRKASVSGVEVSSLCDGERFDLGARRWVSKPLSGSNVANEKVDPDDAGLGERFFPR
ncbi:MAG TPA: cyanophycinase [Candidatus Obscuribacterales bacterium]